MKRISAFTLLELIIVMILTSFIVVAGYFAYTSSVQRLSIFELMSKGKVDLTELDLLLTKDFQECNSASLTTPKQLTLFNANGEQLVYSFDEQSVYRKLPMRIDTFYVSVTKVTSQELELDRLYITELSLSVESGSKDLSLDYFKDYDPNFLMNLGGK